MQLGSRLPARRPLLVYAALFVLASAASAWAPTAGFFIAGHILQGLATGLLLIGAVPPLITRFGVDKLPRTAVVMNLGLFGAVALGPVVGGAAAGADDWRVLLWMITGIGGVALLFAILTYEDQPPDDPDAPWDVIALTLAALGTASLFFGVASLVGRHAYDLLVLGPVLLGIALLVALLVHQRKAEDPLIPVERFLHTIPVAALVAAMAAGAASILLVQLAQQALELKGASPNHAAMLFWPEFGAALLAAMLFGRLILTRWPHVFAFAGLCLLGGGGAVLTGAAQGSDALVVVGSGLAGFGVGASVAPAMFSAGFTMPVTVLPRVFAMVELLRGVAAFLVAPAVLQLAMAVGGPAGLRTGTWIATGIALGGALVAATVYVSGGARPRVPKVEQWLDGGDPAIPSPALGAAVEKVGT